MELFTKLFSDLYHCFDRIVIHGYLSGLSRPEQVVFFFRQVVGAPVVSKELLSQLMVPWINRVFDVQIIHGWPFMLSRYRDGSLEDLIANPLAWSLQDRFASLIQIIRALLASHSACLRSVGLLLIRI